MLKASPGQVRNTVGIIYCTTSRRAVSLLVPLTEIVCATALAVCNAAVVLAKIESLRMPINSIQCIIHDYSSPSGPKPPENRLRLRERCKGDGMASRLFRINPLSSRLSMRKKEKCVLCMVFLVFMTICFGALFFVPDLRDNYLSTYVFVWTPPTSSPINNHHQEDVEVPGQIPKPSEAPGMYAT